MQRLPLSDPTGTAREPVRNIEEHRGSAAVTGYDVEPPSEPLRPFPHGAQTKAGCQLIGIESSAVVRDSDLYPIMLRPAPKG